MKIRVDPLDRLFSSYIRIKAGGVCEYCGRMGRVETSHFHGRRKGSTRYDEDNVVALCHSCHMYLQEHPNIHSEWFEKRLGSERYELLNIRAQKIIKVGKEALKREFTEKIRRLENES